jgi:UDP-N-acetylmuramyl pentapeptide phosphotransferase/UDP-N-acetylglucosamine-1-phosphate transferase
MDNIIYLSIIVLSIFYLNKLFINKNLLLSHSGDKHQEFASKTSVPLIGGIFLIVLFIFFLTKLDKYYEIIIIFFIFLLGIFTDLKILKSPKIRFLIQTFFIILLTFFSKLEIIDTRVDFLNFILEYRFINFCFVVFCLLILMNGSNFIDGLNGLLVGYFIMITIILIKIGFFQYYEAKYDEILFFLSILFAVLLFNIFNKLYLGDSGVYAISIFFGLMIINFHQNHPIISPYFFILLLWYPCFENLFSIIRKFKFNRSPISPDINHFHQLLFYFLKRKNNYTDLINNNFSSFIILLFNSLIFVISLNNIYSTKLQIMTIFFSVVFYVIIYIYLFNFKYNNVK